MVKTQLQRDQDRIHAQRYAAEMFKLLEEEADKADQGAYWERLQKLVRYVASPFFKRMQGEPESGDEHEHYGRLPLPGSSVRCSRCLRTSGAQVAEPRTVRCGSRRRRPEAMGSVNSPSGRSDEITVSFQRKGPVESTGSLALLRFLLALGNLARMTPGSGVAASTPLLWGVSLARAGLSAGLLRFLAMVRKISFGLVNPLVVQSNSYGSQPMADEQHRELREALVSSDRCPECGGELDTGWECIKCGYDAFPIAEGTPKP